VLPPWPGRKKQALDCRWLNALQFFSKLAAVFVGLTTDLMATVYGELSTGRSFPVAKSGAIRRNKSIDWRPSPSFRSYLRLEDNPGVPSVRENLVS